MTSPMQCAICLDDGDHTTTTKFPGCGHAFHTVCLINSVRRNPRCPMCRHLPEGVHANVGGGRDERRVQRRPGDPPPPRRRVARQGYVLVLRV